MHDAMVVERGELGGGSFCFVQIWLWVCTADAKGVKSRKTAARAKHTSLSAPCRPVTPAAHNLLPFNLVLHSSFPFKIVLRVVAIADSAVSDFKARQVDRGRRTQIVSAPSLPHTHLPPDRTWLLHSVIIKAVSANCLHCDSAIKPASFLPHLLPNPLHLSNHLAKYPGTWRGSASLSSSGPTINLGGRATKLISHQTMPCSLHCAALLIRQSEGGVILTNCAVS